MNTMTSNTLSLGSFSRWFDAKCESALVAFFDWALSNKRVQRVVAQHVQDGGLLCRAISEAVRSNMEDFKPDIDANDVNGLDSAIESVLEDAEVHADNVDGLDSAIVSAVEEALDNALDMDEIVERVMKKLIERLHK